MSQKTYLTILKTGIYLSFISVFLVFKNLLFPYITSKQIPFNILIEILFIFWLALIVKYPEYRPRKNWISIGLIAFFAVITLSCFTGVDFNLSFWGDIERMLGVFHLLHFLAFYFIIITVFRDWKDWRNLLIVSVAAATILCLYGLTKNIAYSTVGNTAYVSGYAIFNIFFALILIFRQARIGGKGKDNNWWIISLYSIAIITLLAIFKLTHTRGAYVGLGAGIFFALLLFIILNKSKKIKIYSFSCLAVIAVLISLVFAYPQSSIVKNSSILNTMTQISAKAATFQTRLIAWKAAAKDFKNHPVLGTGHGNFAITFDKYFDPSFYNYTRSETYFDRAHNNIVDIASTTGGLGLLAYLSIFVAAGYYLVKGYRENKIAQHELILLAGLIIAYFIQNLAVFDSLITYISLMVMLGFIYYLASGETESKEADMPLINKEIYALAGAGLVMLIIIFQYNIKPLKMLKGTIGGQIAFAQGDIIGGVEIYKKALSHNTVLDRDSRDSLIRFITANYAMLSGVGEEKAREIFDYTVELAEKNAAYNPGDSLMQMELAQTLNIAARFYEDNPQKFYFYSDRALEAINKSIEASPGRIPIYYIKAQILAGRDEQDKAIETLKYAIGLNEKYYDSFCNLSRYYFVFKQEDKGFEEMDRCLDLGGAELLAPTDYVKSLINYYIGKQDWPKVLKLYQRLAALEPNDAEVWVRLAKVYAQVGDMEKAVEAAKKAGELDPAMKDASEQFIKGLE
ncbi:O-antigen ligase family protein [Patescibacteria group bacterium]|nr:O-antigen ligase family protein [Patescibacteria group bacterium]MBU4347775.1 O-antigen ligase family protein [Patescibacteria group bacterium]MBU4454962.1 O-antigen ligase family protein [Patescibacteria group bacterium]MCG2690837.1 O-antigen ligase family protein [Candidatus Parcubacteria bacterium]